MTLSAPYSEARARGSYLAPALLVFIGNVLLCLFFMPLEMQGFGDAIRGWNQFNALLFAGEEVLGPSNELQLRLMLAGVTLLILMPLAALGLIDERVLVVYLALPVSAYLATKIRPEFVFFPLALISTNLGWRRETAVITLILGLSVSLGENNGLIIVFFRIGVLLFRVVRPGAAVVAVLAGTIVGLCSNLDLLAGFIPELAVYSWTRDIVNPEFSHLETAAVFLSSMTVSAQPPLDFMIGLPCTLLVIFAAHGNKLFTVRFYAQALKRSDFASGILTVLFFTSLTHAFQNARYYFFFVPAVSGRGSSIAFLVFSSWPMTFLLILHHRIVLGV